MADYTGYVYEGTTTTTTFKNEDTDAKWFNKKLPPADVQPVRHGHWIYTPTNLLGYVCSECGNGMCRFNYCPHCGARMDFEKGDKEK